MHILCAYVAIDSFSEARGLRKSGILNARAFKRVAKSGKSCFYVYLVFWGPTNVVNLLLAFHHSRSKVLDPMLSAQREKERESES